MKIGQLAAVGLLVVQLSMIGCSAESNPTYKIARKGVVITEKNFDVVHVYGFIDNREVAQQITSFLNKSEPDTYHYYEFKN